MANILDPKTGLLLAAPYQSNQFVATKRDRRWMAFFASRVVSDTACASLPASPVEGQAVICSGGTNANSIARYSTELAAWEYLTPWAGLTVQDSTGASWSFGGSGWAQQASGGGSFGGATIALGEPAAPSSGVTLFATVSVRNLAPVMTADSSGGYVASASSTYNSAWYAFSGAAQNGWLTNGTSTGWLQLMFPTSVTAVSYSIRPWDVDNFPSRAPTAWTLRGSSDGDAWTALDTQNISSSAWTSGGYLTFPIASPGAYKYYRLDITANGGNGYTGVHDLRINGVGGARLCYKSSDGSVVAL